MKYTPPRRFRGKTMSGIVNLPYGTVCELRGETIYYGGKPLCFVTSENAHNYFSRNDDGQGERRGELVLEIMGRLKLPEVRHKPDPEYPLAEYYMTAKESAKREAARKARNEAWERVWDDPSIRKYKRVEFADYWLFNHDFYNAPIEDLEYILKVVKGETNGQNNQN